MESIPDEVRGVRQRKKHCDPTCCPVCGITVRPHEIEQHYTLELEKLHKPNNSNKRRTMVKDGPSCSSSGTTSSSGSGGSSSGNAVGESSEDPYECWTTYQRIKTNRQARLKMKNKKRKADDPLCPICNERIADEIISHVDLCLQRSEGKSNGAVSDDDDDSVDVESESFDEYEWAGQTRVRASSLLDGGYLATGIGTNITYPNTTNGDDEDEDLNVDGDDTQVYGAAQYSELDVILPLSEGNDKKNDNVYLRNLVIGHTTSSVTENGLNKPTTSKRWSEMIDNNSKNDHPANNSSTIDTVATEDVMSTSQNNSNTTLEPEPMDTTNAPDTEWNEKTNFKSKISHFAPLNVDSQKQIIESLKDRIREYEQQISNKSKCLICIDEFRIPVVSICCWHVHCEECWLRTLGARKLCPQCNMITSPSDLRRIYM